MLAGVNAFDHPNVVYSVWFLESYFFFLLLEGEMGLAYTTDKIPLHVIVKFSWKSEWTIDCNLETSNPLKKKKWKKINRSPAQPYLGCMALQLFFSSFLCHCNSEQVEN